jgi:hypothetical protein
MSDASNKFGPPFGAKPRSFGHTKTWVRVGEDRNNSSKIQHETHLVEPSAISMISQYVLMVSGSEVFSSAKAKKKVRYPFVLLYRYGATPLHLNAST